MLNILLKTGVAMHSRKTLEQHLNIQIWPMLLIPYWLTLRLQKKIVLKKKLAKFQIWSVPQWATSCSYLNQDEIWRLNPPLTLSLQWNPAQVSILEVLGGDTASHISKDFKTLFKKKIINLNEPEASLSSLCTPQTAVVWCHYVWTLKFSCCLICSSLSLWRMYSEPQNTLQVDLCRWVRLQTLLVPIGIVAPGMLEIC